MGTEAEATERLFFDEHQWSTIEAAMARIIPSDRDPGAREAGAIRFVDRYLSGIGYIYARPDGSGFLSLRGRVAEVWHGRIENLRHKYTEGVADLDLRARERFGNPFVDLSGAQQDEILDALASPDREREIELAGAVSGFEQPEVSMQQMIVEHELDFFPLLALHTRQGFYADPVYGGNQGHIGWKIIGFPGPESMAEVHQGRYSTLAYFADQTLGGRQGDES